MGLGLGVGLGSGLTPNPNPNQAGVLGWEMHSNGEGRKRLNL